MSAPEWEKLNQVLCILGLIGVFCLALVLAYDFGHFNAELDRDLAACKAAGGNFVREANGQRVCGYVVPVKP